MIGDGYCHDWANIEACEYDANDCCLPIINDQHCTECKCHLNGLRHPPSCQCKQDHFHLPTYNKSLYFYS